MRQKVIAEKNVAVEEWKTVAKTMLVILPSMGATGAVFASRLLGLGHPWWPWAVAGTFIGFAFVGITTVINRRRRPTGNYGGHFEPDCPWFMGIGPIKRGSGCKCNLVAPKPAKAKRKLEHT